MSTVASRDLRNHTAEILRRVSDGAHITVTANGQPVAELAPPRTTRRQSLTRAEILHIIDTAQADPGLTAELAELAGDTTDDL